MINRARSTARLFGLPMRFHKVDQVPTMAAPSPQAGIPCSVMYKLAMPRRSLATQILREHVPVLLRVCAAHRVAQCRLPGATTSRNADCRAMQILNAIPATAWKSSRACCAPCDCVEGPPGMHSYRLQNRYVSLSKTRRSGHSCLTPYDEYTAWPCLETPFLMSCCLG